MTRLPQLFRPFCTAQLLEGGLSRVRVSNQLWTFHRDDGKENEGMRMMTLRGRTGGNP